MENREVYENREDFLKALKEKLEKGVPKEALEVILPCPDHEVEKLLTPKPSLLKFFTLPASLLGLATGLGFPIFTVLDWPKISGGKPLISITPFIVIGFELTILFGAVISFFGFLFLARFPKISRISHPENHDNCYVLTERVG